MWVLIIIMASAGGVNATTAEFTTQTKCQAAGQWAIQKSSMSILFK